MAKKGEVRFNMYSEEVKNSMLELEKQGLKASAKILKDAAKAAVPILSGDLEQVIATWVRVNKKTGEVKLQLGVYNASRAKKKNLPPAGTRAHLVEFGSQHNQAKSFLKAPTIENVNAIRAAQAEYLPNITHMKEFEDLDQEVE